MSMKNKSLIVTIEKLSHEGRGIAHVDGKTTFVLGALPREEVEISYFSKMSRYDEARVVRVIKASKDRVIPQCSHFDICGGCSLQHINQNSQLKHKENILLEHLSYIGGIEPKKILPPITGEIWGYRRRARLSVRYVIKKGKLLVGFHEKNGRYVADIDSCEILSNEVGKKIKVLTDLIGGLTIYDKIPQIEIACGDEVVAIVLRCLEKPSLQDIERIEVFAREHLWQVYLQEGGIDSSSLLINPSSLSLSYELFSGKKHATKFFFLPTDFVQINANINSKMAALVLELLQPKEDDLILDLFCGLGNFTLPLARFCKEIFGVEGSFCLIKRAEENAKYNAITNAKFHCCDLTQDLEKEVWYKNKFSKILLDPPRTGALEICRILPKLGAEKILYISCNTATLARDLKELCYGGYRLEAVRVLDMFPHTKHVEAMALLVKT